MSDYHIAKHVMGELTFGEYWNLIGSTASVAVLKGAFHKRMTMQFSPMEDCIRFNMIDDGRPRWSLDIPLKSKVKVSGHSVRTTDHRGEEITIEFYELAPVPGLMP